MNRQKTIVLRPANREELEIFDAMDRQDHVRYFLTTIGLEAHRAFFDTSEITYLSIDNAAGECCGYFTIVHEPENDSVEIRRILVDRDSLGIGQAALCMAENWCREHHGVRRIWLDVFDENTRGRHVYEKLGYRWFNTTRFMGRQLHFLEKFFNTRGSGSARSSRLK